MYALIKVAMKAQKPTKKKEGRSGKRPGAGRPRGRWRSDPPHRRRPELSPRHPVHVVLRTYLDRLRVGKVYAAIRRVLKHFLGRDDFRVVHLSIQTNHIHLLVEATDRRALWKGMQSLASRCAHALNAAFGCERGGNVFPHRYHATQITKPWQARSALAYVLNDWRKHSEDLVDAVTMKAKLDPYSSGISFTGWAGFSRF